MISGSEVRKNLPYMAAKTRNLNIILSMLLLVIPLLLLYEENIKMFNLSDIIYSVINGIITVCLFL